MKLDMTSHDCTQLYTYLNLSRVIKGFPTRGKSVSHAWDTASHREVFVRRLLASLALLLALGSSTAWAQTDYSGEYYLANNNKDNYAGINHADNFYLCPANEYYDGSTMTTTDNGKPFLTTYNTLEGDNSLWIIQKVDGQEYYTIKHKASNKYLTVNNALTGYGKANRKRVHLEDVASLTDRNYFTIEYIHTKSGVIRGYTIGCLDAYKNGNNQYLNPANGNFPSLTSQGTENPKSGGLVGFWEKGQASGDYRGSVWFFEIPKPSITLTDATTVTISYPYDNTVTIYYTTNGSTPTTSSSVYSAPITFSTETVFKAIAVLADGTQSAVTTLTLADFTYKILDTHGNVAIQHTVQQPVGKALTGYSDIPAAIRSPYIADETVRFFSDSGHSTEIFETPGSNADIYVTYTTSNLGNKFLHLDDGRLLNVTVNGEYIFDNSGTLSHEATEDNLANTDRMWRIKGEDPYAVVIQNVSTGKCFHYETSALPATLSLTVEGSASHFIIMNGSGTPKSLAEGQMELMPVTGENVTSNTYYRVGRTNDPDVFNITTTSGTAAQQIQAVSAKASVTYYLIDQAGMKDPGGAIFATIISTESAVELPAEWQSPLVSAYHYYKTRSWNAETLKWDFSEPVTSTLEASEIYVTYDVNNLVSFDDTDDDTNGSTTYMLEFTDGSFFKQEDGDNGVMNTTQKAVYPYANGDGCLNVYGSEQWSAQISSGASTRTRWLWYVVSPNKDPYHVKIMSRSGVVSSHNYFRTYVVNYGGSNHVVTGVTTKHADAVAAEEEPTEYMVLKTAAGKCKLVTKDKIDDGSTDERRTVTSFEQYWKTYETVSNWGEYHYAPPVDNPAFNGITLNYYEARANGRPINTSDPTVQNSKTYEKVNHFFQTINMGSEGEFTFQATTLVPQVILLDQHGWEIMRQPLYSDDACTIVNTAALKHFDSPMVESYHWYPSASVQHGYHKFTVSDPAITIYEEVNGKWVDSERDYTHNSTSLADDPYSHITPTQPKSVKSDMYVTYTVKSEYARLYTGAARAEDTRAAAFLVKQGSDYAVNSSNTLTTTTTAPTDMESVDDEMKWYLRPNFNIDAEMGYKYWGQPGAEPEAKTKQATEQDYYAAGMNGFDPYNVQVQSASDTLYYFRTNAASATLTNGMWVGTSGTGLSLQTIGTGHISAKGYEQTTLDITNATFMVVDDGAGNMRLMPRFDHAKVINSLDDEPRLTTTAAASDYLTLTLTPQVVHYAHEINVMGGQYILASNFAIDIATPIGTESAPFTGLIDGRLYTIASLTMPLIAYAKDALIKNVIIESASVSSNSSTVTVGEDEKTALGAICNYATGSTRIYNCGINGGSVGASNDYVGGIVGLLDHDPENKTGARVINCYSYANITGGTEVGGIVGRNNFASNSTDIRTMVMNCMFYGDITDGTNKAPIYNGLIISNVGTNGLGNYNYFLAEKPYVEKNQINTYNCALMAETRFLQRFEFYRLLLNSHLELAGWYATGNYDKDEMMKWVLETADRTNATPKKPYPVLKQRLTNDGTRAKYYPSIINIDAENAPTSGDRNIGKNLGTLAVSISGVGSGAVYGAPTGASITKSSLSLPITDKDYERFNFNYRKVQLPYYNDVGTGNYTENRVVTGWKITAISGGTRSFSKGSDATASVDENGNITLTTPYNFADRKCTDKDLFSESERVFNQGAYWDVPEGVTSITIEPYWAQCVYVSDAYPDVVYNQAMSTAYNVKTVGTVNEAARYTNNKSYSINGDNQVVYTTMGNAAGQMPTTGNVYDNAIVLVGNVHSLDLSYKSKDKSYTIMSIDLDKDNEPDYSYILRYNSRLRAHPVRVDFLNIPGLGMAQKSTGGTGTYNLGIMQPLGWFESTNTSLFRFTQFEYDKKDRVNSPMILQGGVIEQWVTVGGAETTIKEGKTVTYYHVGGNVWFKEFHIGVHQDKTQDEFFSPHPPISVTGGDFDEFYLTGLYNTPNNNADDDAECYINGGRFGKVAGTGIQGIGSATNHTHGNIFWQIDNADIDEFYAGGINAAHIAEGNIYTVITNSRVDQFCGGPKFGNMNSTKKVVTNADNCTFRAFFGAGYGGNSYNRRYPQNQNNVNNINWNNWVNSEYTQTYNADYKGVSTRIDYQFLPMSGNTSNVARLCVDYVSFSLATTYDVTSKLKDCTITTNPLGRLSIAEDYKCLGNFYGGGSLGKVNGPVKSTLTNCTVEGNVFGAGYSASLPTIEVDARGFETEPYYYDQSGTYRAGVKYKANEAYKPTTYTWAKKTSDSWIDKTNHILYTNEDLTSLGTVTGLVTLTVDGTTVVGDNAVANSGNVYGGGESSDATGDVNVHILSGTMTDVYGGGKGETTVVSGDVTVNINGGTVNRDVYGGSAFGAVNATKNPSTGALSHTAEKATAVNINNGAVSGSVFGGGLGKLAVVEPATPAIVAQNFGNTAINIVGGTVGTAVFGGANVNGVLNGTSTVTITNGTVGTTHDPVSDVVFGGGYGEPTVVQGAVRVDIGTSGQASGGATLNGHIYGGGALGSVNSSTEVNLNKGTINGNVFGGGLGQQEAAAVLYANAAEYNTAKGTSLTDEQFAALTTGQKTKTAAVSAVAAVVGGNATVTLDGAAFSLSTATVKDDENNDVTAYTTGQIFGGNNLQGSPSGHIKVHVKKTVPVTGHEADTYYLGAVYGGGNEADYNPTADDFAEVIIEGCDDTRIKDVYGGGNAAAVPATEVWILGDKIIENVFGGGNGELGASHAAHVGFHRLTPSTKSDYTNGTGKTKVNLVGGTITNVYGGSNSNGDIRGGANIFQPLKTEYPGYEEGVTSCCDYLRTTNIYGGGKNADMSGGTNIVLGCMPDEWITDVYAGAQNADVAGDVSLTITSGKFHRVFGGNKDGGKLKGSITVNIEETGGCSTPILIGELYGGGNLAGYSIYGYKDNGDPRTQAEYNTWYSALSEEDKAKPENQPYHNPQVNIRAFTSIGSVYGGGYQARMIADPHVDINVVKGSHAANAYAGETLVDVPIKKKNESTGEIEDATIDITLPAHAEDKIGTIGNVFGGGNLAEVVGNAEVNIGSETTAIFITEPTHLGTKGSDYTERGDGKFEATVEGANITGCVYGGGNEADITGNTQVNICTKNDGAKYQRVAPGTAGVTIAQDVFGAGKGKAEDVTSALVRGTSTIVMSDGTVGQSVYGGGQLSQVGGNTYITVNGGTIGDSTGANAGEIYGNVYGGGKGNTTNVRSGLVMGNTNITIENTVADADYAAAHSVAEGSVITSPSIYHNIYGGGAHGSVGTYTYASEAADAAIASHPDGDNGTATITITGGTIGVNGKENGMVFGSSRGDVGAPGTIYDKVAWVYNTNVVIGTVGQGSNHTSPHIKGSVYGGGENGHTYNNASVAIHSGLVGITDILPEDPEGQKGARYPYRGNVYGAGCGTDKYYSDPLSETHDGRGDTYNPLSGVVGMTTTVLIDGGHVVRDVYGGGAMGSVKGSPSVKGSATVTIDGNAEVGADGSGGGYVFAAARGDITVPTMATVGTSTLNISGGTIWADAYGGGQNGAVEGAVTVNMTGGTVKHDVYGGGALANTNTDYDAGSSPADSYITNVTLNGTTIEGNLYGGGLGDLASLGAGHSDVAANVNGPVTVTVSNGKATNVFGCNNLYGAPQSTVAVNVTGTAAVESGSAISNVYGGGNLAAYTGNPTVTVSGGTVNNVYGGGLGASAIVTGNTAVTISGTANIGNDVFGGGSQADVTGSVNVTVSGGKVYNDVYGGGALANTNTANWDFTTPTDVYIEVTGLTMPSYAAKEVKAGDDITGLYTRSGSGTVGDPYVYTPTTPGKAPADGTYYVLVPGSSVEGLYTDDSGTEAHGTAQPTETYYEKRHLPGTWAEGKSSASNTTTVTLIGGVIGNAYGGGLGDPTHPVYVCGDVVVSVNDPSAIGANTGVGFTRRTNDHVTIDGDPTEYVVPLTGRVFGCNNIKGTPLGDVHVYVHATRQLDESGNVVPHVDASSHVPEEIQAVYGGGNQADYVPASGKGTHVEIDGCDRTTIMKVYGGGSSASVPATDVLIKAALEVGFAFGGGNGGDKVYDYVNSKWKNNDGAAVNGLASIRCQGGKMGQIFGGSDRKGNCRSTSVTQAQEGDCDLVITRLYGAGNEADVDGPVNIIISACTAGNTKIEYVCGGSYNAHITGDVNLTITSGFFKSVYGGNESSGGIAGHITVNIEETNDCKPIIIGNLVGGGNEAPYPGTDKNGDDIDEPGRITVNVKSATRIDNIYGGGYGAEVLGDTEVNINMRKGYWAGKTYSGTGETYPDAIGAIGNVFGGGNAGRVRGSTTVNIGTSTTVGILKRNGSGQFVDSDDEVIFKADGSFEEGKSWASLVLENKPVLGANITGNVYGGGNKAEVTENTNVHICAKPGTYESVDYSGVDYSALDEFGHAQAYAGIKIGGSVYGGGNMGSVGTYDQLNTAMPTTCTVGTGSTTVVVMGDAEIGPNNMKMPTFSGNVFGASKGSNNIAADANVPYKSFINNSYVTIGGTAFIKGSVYGGGENGHVLNDTHVTIQDNCQIGNGDEVNRRYTAAEWDYDVTKDTPDPSLAECHHWPYEAPYAPYDKYVQADGTYPNGESAGGGLPATGSAGHRASDGHTFYGNVFGGGCGDEPYAAGKWLSSAGAVYGNTNVTITGGHILTNIYGGNEQTNVGREKSTTTGTATVNFGGTATLGVPRTLSEIAAHPVTCYLFGAGKGDQRVFFNKQTNVNRTVVNVTGGRIYGSVFGGGEDGHVMGDVDMNISGTPLIGTWGTSYVDGNVFGGGRGFAGDAYTAGNVGGSVDIDIDGGTMLGSIYGGGRLGSVGYGLYSSTEAGYGSMRDDDKFDDGTTEGASTFFPNGRGHVNIDISGTTTIGNVFEYRHHTSSVSTAGKTAEQIAAERKAELASYHMPSTDATYDSGRGYYMLNHPRGGNVFGGGMGRREKLGSDTEPITEIMWQKLGSVKSTKVNIHDANVWIKGSVYGGGELGAVTGKHMSGKDVSTEIIINEGTIGTVMGTDINNDGAPSTGKGSGDTRYSFGSIYGGGYGTLADIKTVADGYAADIHTFAALVGYDTDITLTAGTVRASIFGGGQLACVLGSTNVLVNGGSIGVDDVRVTEGPQKGYVLFGNWRMGNVFGGGKGDERAVNAGSVGVNATVTINGGNVYHNVYGGGAIGSVGTYTRYTDDSGSDPVPAALKEFIPIASPKACADGTGTATVTITGGQIGINGWDNGMVNGSGRGDVSKPGADGFDQYDRMAWVKETVVTIGNVGSESTYTAPQPQIKGSVYGGGENGHNFANATVHLYSGTVGTDASTSYDNGNVYGSGCGTDTYTGDDSKSHHSPTAGFVRGSSSVNIHGGMVLNSVYGGGSMASIGEHGEQATLNISGGVIQGSAYGGPRGDLRDEELKARAKQTVVNISGGTVNNDVYGGGMAGIVENSVTVNMTGGTVNNNLYGGGALADTNTENWNASTSTWADGMYNAETKKTTNTTTVNLKGGHILHDAYGGALGRFAQTSPAEAAIEPKVYGDILVELNQGVADNALGCIVDKVFGCNDLQGTPMGHVEVHVYATQNSTTGNVETKSPNYYPNKGESQGYKEYLKALIDVAKPEVSVLPGIIADTITAAQTYYDALPAEGDLTDEHISNITTHAKKVIRQLEKVVTYDVSAVYGGGDLAPYIPHESGERAEVIIEGCHTSCIQQVYGGGNAASTPANFLRVNECFLINEAFGGGNGKDSYEKNGKWYENAGANVGYYNYYDYDTSTTDGESDTDEHRYKAVIKANAITKADRQANYRYGTGEATTQIAGGRIRYVYGGSNERGNIRTIALSQYEESGTCPMYVGESYGAGKNAEIDGEVSVEMGCAGEYVEALYGGSKNADMNSGVTLNITNGSYGKVFGGNNVSGTVNGPITINIEEKGCKPIIIGELYGGGFYAPYSIYGYKTDGAGHYETIEEDDPTSDDPADKIDSRIPLKNGESGALAIPHRDPQINVISATRIGTIYGGGYQALMIGSPSVNVNMQKGKVIAKYASSSDFAPGPHGTGDNAYVVESRDDGKDAILAIGKIGNVFGGGNQADIIGNTHVDIGTGKWLDVTGKIITEDEHANIYTYEEKTPGEWKWYDINGDEVAEAPTPSRNAAFITENVYGGGKMGNVGDFTKNVSGKPISCASGTGICTVTISNGDIGPDDMNMWHLNGSGNVRAADNPDNKGHIFGGGQGTELPANDNDAFVDSTLVIINGTAWVKGSVFGGGENGHVLHDAGVRIGGDCQIGNGHILKTDGSGTITVNRGVNRRYTPAEWAAGHLFVEGDEDIATPLSAEETALRAAASGLYTASLPECDSWLYGKEISGGKIVANAQHSPYDKFEGTGGYDAKGGKRVATSGRSFNGSVYGGGSGFFPYSAGNWNPKAGQVEGDTWVEVTGGHIMTSLYGGNKMSTMLGDAHVVMTGGTVGVPRTLEEIDDHPVTCYVFGGGKGEGRDFLDNNTDVRKTFVTVSGGWVYGSVFGGAEDGHVLGNTVVNISGAIRADNDTPADVYEKAYAGTITRIGTWGTSYVDGNIFGGGRGFDGINAKAGRIGGNVTINITGGEMLGSVYGGGRLGSVGMAADGTFTADPTTPAVYYTQGECDAYNSEHSLTSGDEGFLTTSSVKTPAGIDPKYGHITINVSGGRIGNEHEYVFIDDSNKDGIPTSAYRKTGFNDAASFTLKTAETPHPNDPTMGLITEGETVNYRRLYHAMGGSIYGGCMGRLTTLNGSVNPNWHLLGIARTTTINVSGSPTIKSSIFAGAEFGKVTGNTYVTVDGTPTIGTLIYKSPYTAPQYGFGSVYGGGYGSEYLLTAADKDAGATAEPRECAGIVEGETNVTINGGKVMANIYGGGKTAVVNGDTHITITGGEVGLKKVRASDGYVMYGSSNQGSVFGAGRGSLTDAKIAVVKGNTYINISGGAVYHNIYGGGAQGSVGDFKISDASTVPHKPAYIPISGVPYGWDTEADGVTPNGNSTGNATITITGGVIGISGRDNGMVYGSSRGDIEAPSGSPIAVDPYDKVAWVNNSYVTIGTDGGTYETPLITGNVYGGGENGHNSADSHVNIYSGTVGVVSGPWATIGDAANTRVVNNSRGGVYGAGSGQDTYTLTVNEKDYEYHNPKSGMVGGNSYVLVKGGLIARNVYGGGFIASLGVVTNEADTTSTAKHDNPLNGFALSWPYKIEYQENTGIANVTIQGGHIGMGSDRIVGLDNGNIYGGSKGAAGDRYAMAHLANVKESHVTIDFPYNDEDPSTLVGSTNYAKNCIEGSVFGGGENGHVMGDTHVLVKDGFVSHSLFGGGRGEGLYTGKLIHVGTGDGYAGSPKPAAVMTGEMDIFDWLAGKVYGNTHLTLVKGRVLNNALGGGYMASVGVGNYAGGDDDFYTAGYGETLTGHLWTSSFDPTAPISESNKPDNAWYFLNSGNTYVNLFGGEIGTADTWDGLPAGNIFGGSRGKAAPNLRESQRHLYCPEWFNGYVNETHVTIGGGYTCILACEDKNDREHAVGEIMSLQELQDMFATTAVLVDGMPSDTYWTPIAGSGPTIHGSVYGGAQDGRVRRDTHVIINDGEIGYAYNATNQTTLGTSDLDDVQWRHRGNVYGAGSGMGKYKFDFNYDGDTDDNDGSATYYTIPTKEEDYSQHAGCVIHYTQVDINGGQIHRNVYGGGSLACVGPPAIPPRTVETAYKRGTTTRDAAYGGGTIGQGWWSECAVNIAGTVGSHTDFQKEYGGEVYGASRGETELKDRESEFSYVIWTKVNVLRGAWVKGNVFGGGDSGMVKRDTEVNVGFE